MNQNLENLVRYVSQNERGVNRLAYLYGYLPPVSVQGREGFLYQGLQDEGENFIRDIARIHPDRELILNADGSVDDGAWREPNVIRLPSSQTQQEIIPSSNVADKAFILRVAFILVLFVIIYNIIKK